MSFIVAIDGVAGSGKSTTAKSVAKRLNLAFIDTGAMYRVVTLRSMHTKDESDIVKITKSLKIELKDGKVFEGNEDLTEAIRENVINQNVSRVAAIAKVRECIVAKQRELAKGKQVIIEGRDITSVVFPNANVKIFMTASSECRAKRRYKSLGISYKECLKTIKDRDHKDSTRKASPLTAKNVDFVIDTTKLTFDEQVNKIVELIEIAKSNS